MVKVEPISICMQCQHRSCGGNGLPPCMGIMICTISGDRVESHAAALACPIGSFRRGFGDLLAKLFDRFQLRRLIHRAGIVCGCADRQRMLNNAMPWSAVWNWTLEARQAWLELAGVVVDFWRRPRRQGLNRPS